MNKKSTTEANLELNNEFNSDSAPTKSSSTAEANMKLNKHFAVGDEHPGEITPTYLTHETAAIKVTGDNE